MNTKYKRPKTLNATDPLATDYELILPESAEPTPSITDQFYTTTSEGSITIIGGNPVQAGGQAQDISQWTFLTYSMNQANLGTGLNTRQSPRILVTRIQAKIYCEIVQALQSSPGTVSLQTNAIVELMLWLDRQANGAQPYTPSTNLPIMYEQVTNNAAGITYSQYCTLAWPNRAQLQRLTLLEKQKWEWNTQNSVATSNVVGAWDASWAPPTGYGTLPYQPCNATHLFEFDIKNIQIPITFDDTQAQGTLSQIIENNIFMDAKISTSSQYLNAANALLLVTSRITFTNLN